MKAPDKINIQPDAHDRWFEGNGPNSNFLEYIRRDVLLEWAKEEEKKWQDSHSCSNDDYDVGRIDTCKELIEKLDSL